MADTYLVFVLIRGALADEVSQMENQTSSQSLVQP